jgi:hypothetical protein
MAPSTTTKGYSLSMPSEEREFRITSASGQYFIDIREADGSWTRCLQNWVILSRENAQLAVDTLRRGEIVIEALIS